MGKVVVGGCAEGVAVRLLSDMCQGRGGQVACEMVGSGGCGGGWWWVVVVVVVVMVGCGGCGCGSFGGGWWLW